MEIQTYNKEQLYNLITSEAFRSMPVVPITTHRAISHINNPRADKEDILMIIAYDGGQMVGYLGVFADRIFNTEGGSFKCGWLSCIWVDPNIQIRGLAKQLVNRAFSAWDGALLVTDFAPEAGGVYNRSGKFNDLRINEGLRCYFRFNLQEVLPKKNAKYKPYSSLLKAIDGVANLPIDMRLSLMKITQNTSLIFKPVTEIDPLFGRYILSKQTDSIERRNGDDFNWIIKYPWLIESKPTEESRRYHFSAVADRFHNLCFRLEDKGVIKGYLHLMIRDNHLKIPYAYYEREYLPDVVQHIYKLMLEYKLNMLTVFHPALVEYFKSNTTPFIYKRTIRRSYIISTALYSHFPDRDTLQIQDGDADCAFT